jgi:hypothetical protein
MIETISKKGKNKLFDKIIGQIERGACAVVFQPDDSLKERTAVDMLIAENDGCLRVFEINPNYYMIVNPDNPSCVRNF